VPLPAIANAMLAPRRATTAAAASL